MKAIHLANTTFCVIWEEHLKGNVKFGQRFILKNENALLEKEYQKVFASFVSLTTIRIPSILSIKLFIHTHSYNV